MNKLLTTITLLCFSVAANADIYFCESSQEATVMPGFLDGRDDPDSQKTFIMDTEKGFKVVGGKPDEYIRSCSSESIKWSCTYVQDFAGEASFDIWTDNLEFRFINKLDALAMTVVYAGTCAKA